MKKIYEVEFFTTGGMNQKVWVFCQTVKEAEDLAIKAMKKWDYWFQTVKTITLLAEENQYTSAQILITEELILGDQKP